MDLNSFILIHAEDDVSQLALKRDLYQNLSFDINYAISQIAARQKAKSKIPFLYNCLEVRYPVMLSMEQCSSQATALFKSSLINGSSLVDLTGGFGVDALFFAPLVKDLYYVEKQSDLCNLMIHNAEVLNLPQIKVFHDDAFHFLKQCPSVDYFYIDPARRDKYGKRLFSIEQSEPNVLELLPSLFKKCRKSILLKLSPMIDIALTIRKIPQVRELFVVAVNGECKELLLLINSDTLIENRTFNAIDIKKNSISQFAFNEQEENEASVEIAQQIETYLYEPNAAILKIGAFKLIASRYGLKKLHPHTHFYTSSSFISDFPGRIFKIDKISNFSKESRSQLLSNLLYANVITKNFPISTEQLRKELKLKDGGDNFLVATTIFPNQHCLLLAKLCNQVVD